MSDYIYPGCESEELEQAILKNKALPLIREIAFKYKLKVLRAIVSRENAHEGSAFVMAPTEGVDAGFPIGEVSCITERSYNLGDEILTDYYAYYSPFFQKSRGRHERERSTIKAKKLASLMATIKKIAAIPSGETIIYHHIKSMKDGVRRVATSMGSVNKHTFVESDQLQVIISAAINNQPLTSDLLAICKKQLDIYNEADKLLQNKVSEVKRMFGKSFYAIGANMYGDILVGVMNAEISDKGYTPDAEKFRILKAFKRVNSFAEAPDVLPIMTMLKVASEGLGRDMIAGHIPRGAQFFQELDLVVEYYSYPSLYDFIWALTPCSEEQL